MPPFCVCIILGHRSVAWSATAQNGLGRPPGTSLLHLRPIETFFRPRDYDPVPGRRLEHPPFHRWLGQGYIRLCGRGPATPQRPDETGPGLQVSRIGALGCQYAPYFSAAAIMARTFSGLASQGTSHSVPKINPPPGAQHSMRSRQYSSTSSGLPYTILAAGTLP